MPHQVLFIHTKNPRSIIPFCRFLCSSISQRDFLDVCVEGGEGTDGGPALCGVEAVGGGFWGAEAERSLSCRAASICSRRRVVHVYVVEDALAVGGFDGAEELLQEVGLPVVLRPAFCHLPPLDLLSPAV